MKVIFFHLRKLRFLFTLPYDFGSLAISVSKFNRFGMFMLLIMVNFSLSAQTPRPAIEIVLVADYESWMKKGDLSEDTFKDRMEMVGTNLTSALTENYDFRIDAVIPDQNLLIIKNMEEDIDVSGPFSSSGGVGARIRDYVETRLPEIDCVDAIILLDYEPNLYGISGRESGQPFSQGAVLGMVTWNPRKEHRLIPVGNVVAHEIGHGFDLGHLEDLGLGDEYCTETQTTINAWGEADTNDCSAMPEGAINDNFLLAMMCEKRSNFVTENYFSPCHIAPIHLNLIEEYVLENPEIFNPSSIDCDEYEVIINSNTDEIHPDVESCEGDNIYTYTTTIINDNFTQRNNLYLKITLSSAPSNPTIFIEDNNFFYHTPTQVRSTVFNLVPVKSKSCLLTLQFLPEYRKIELL